MSPASDANRSILPGVTKKRSVEAPSGRKPAWRSHGPARSGGRFLSRLLKQVVFPPNRRETTSNNQPRLITLVLIIVFKDVILAPPNHNFALLTLLLIPFGLRERCNCRINDPVMRPCLSTQSRSDILILIVCKKRAKPLSRAEKCS